MRSEELPPEFEKARKYVSDNEDSLREKYGGDVLAVLGYSGVIDYGADKFELAARVNQRAHTSISPLFGTIDDILNPPVRDNPSTELEAISLLPGVRWQE